MFLERGPTGEGYLRLEAHGNLYQGNVYGVYSDGKRRRDPEVNFFFVGVHESNEYRES